MPRGKNVSRVELIPHKETFSSAEGKEVIPDEQNLNYAEKG
jgi:hypothetical protein